MQWVLIHESHRQYVIYIANTVEYKLHWFDRLCATQKVTKSDRTNFSYLIMLIQSVLSMRVGNPNIGQIGHTNVIMKWTHQIH